MVWISKTWKVTANVAGPIVMSKSTSPMTSLLELSKALTIKELGLKEVASASCGEGTD